MIEHTTCRCILCHSEACLSMYAHKIDGYIVGWVFVCPACEDNISSKSITVK